MEGKELSPMLHGPKEYMRGQLIHEAMTRVPVNTRTLMEVERAMTTRKEDAESIIGEELAEELEEQAKLVGKSQALVIKAEDDMSDCAEGESEEDCRKRLLAGKVTEAEPGMELIPTKADAKKDEPDDEEEEENGEEGKKKKKKKEEMKSEVSDPVSDVMKELSEIKSLLSAKPESHPLDNVFAELKAQYDTQVASNASEEDFLHAMQEPFSALGEAIKSAVKPVESEPIVENPLTQTVTMLSQQVNLILTKLDGLTSQPSVPQSAPVIPPRRSIDSRLLKEKSQIVEKSTTPTLRSIINQTT
jgi:hypothetical protein